jgi:hypothetical protein
MKVQSGFPLPYENSSSSLCLSIDRSDHSFADENDIASLLDENVLDLAEFYDEADLDDSDADLSDDSSACGSVSSFYYDDSDACMGDPIHQPVKQVRFGTPHGPHVFTYVRHSFRHERTVPN